MTYVQNMRVPPVLAAVMAAVVLTLLMPGCKTNQQTGEPEQIQAREIVRLTNLGLMVAAMSDDGFSQAEMDAISDKAQGILNDLPLTDDAKGQLVALNGLISGNMGMVKQAIEDENWLLLGTILTDEYLAATEPQTE